MNDGGASEKTRRTMIHPVPLLSAGLVASRARERRWYVEDGWSTGVVPGLGNGSNCCSGGQEIDMFCMICRLLQSDGVALEGGTFTVLCTKSREGRTNWEMRESREDASWPGGA